MKKRRFIIIIPAIILLYYLICPLVCSKYINILKLGTRSELIENPFEDDQNYYTVKKYHHTSVGTFSILNWGGSSRYKDIYSWGLADENNNIIIPLSKEHHSPIFCKAYGITPENSVDSVNVISIKRSSIPAYQANGKPFDALKYFKNNTYIYDNIITRPAFRSYSKEHILVNSGAKILTTPGENFISWYGEDIIIVGKRETTILETSPRTYQYDFLYGAYSVTGDIIIPFDKVSVDEVKQLLDSVIINEALD